MIRYLSLFSGIEAATVAWHPLGWHPVAFAEIEKFPCAVLAHHWPDVPNLGDVTKITDAQIAALGPIDVVIGGSPCQDLSIAGKRAGLAGERSSLFHDQLRIFHAARTFCGARFLLWENVPGAFSTNKGADFARVVGAMAGCELIPPKDGWGTEGVALGSNGLVEWCVLDAQWFGVAQRRKRCFALLDSGNWADRPPILSEPESMRGDTPPRRGSGKDVAGILAARTRSGGGLGTDFDLDGELVSHTLRGEGFDGSEDGTGRGTPLVCGTISDSAGGADENDAEQSRLIACYLPEIVPHAVSSKWAKGSSGPAGNEVANLIAFDCKAGGNTIFSVDQTPGTLRGNGHGGGHAAIAQVDQCQYMVRILTPRECERLQGFPDDHTVLPNRKPADSPRYKAIGNSMAVPVIRWIGRKIQQAMDVA